MVTCKLWKEIIEDILHKKTIYRIVSKQKNNFNYNTYIHIKCNKCKNYTNFMLYYNNNIQKKCLKCKSKEIVDINKIINKITNLEIIIILNGNNVKNINIFWELINIIYSNLNIKFSNLILCNDNKILKNIKHNKYIDLIIEKIINKTQQDLYVYSVYNRKKYLVNLNNNEDDSVSYKNKYITINNNKLRTLFIPEGLMGDKSDLYLPNLEKLFIYCSNGGYYMNKTQFLNIYNNVCKNSKIKEIIISKDHFNILKNYIFPKDITLSIISNEYVNDFNLSQLCNKLYSILENNNIRKIKLYNFNERLIFNLNKLENIEKIIINKNHSLKYIKKYKKIVEDNE